MGALVLRHLFLGQLLLMLAGVVQQHHILVEHLGLVELAAAVRLVQPVEIMRVLLAQQIQAVVVVLEIIKQHILRAVMAALALSSFATQAHLLMLQA